MIYTKYIKERETNENIDANLELIYSIFNTQSDLMNASNNYEYAEGDMIDYYSYQIKANKAKLDYLIKNAKSKGIIINRTKQIELRSFEEIQAI